MNKLSLVALAALSFGLAACGDSTDRTDTAAEPVAAGTAMEPAPIATETAVVPGPTSTVAVPVPGATATTNPGGDRVTIDRKGVEVDVGNGDTRIKADIEP